MTKKELLLAAALFAEAANQFGNHGCNDMPEDLTADWTAEEKRSAACRFSIWNGDPENECNFDHIGDSSWMAYYAAKLKEMAQ